MNEASILRKNFAKFLAPLYIKDPTEIARICDEELDPTGNLLGYVRDRAMELEEKNRSLDMSE